MCGETLPEPHQASGVLGVCVEPLVMPGTAGAAAEMLLSTLVVELRVDDRLDPLVLWHSVVEEDSRLVLTLDAPTPHAVGDASRPPDLDWMDGGQHFRSEAVIDVMVGRMLEAIHMTGPSARVVLVVDEQPLDRFVDLTKGHGITILSEVAYFARYRLLVQSKGTLILRFTDFGSNNYVRRDAMVACSQGYRSRSGDDLAI